MLKKKPETLYFLVLFFLVFLTYQESLNNYFLADDALWLMQAKAAKDDFIDVFRPVSGYVRPAIVLLFTLLYTLFGLNPKPYYLVCVSLHFINTILVYMFSCAVFSKIETSQNARNISFYSALFFSVLYAHCEAVIWMGALGDVLVCFFCLLSLTLFIHWLDSDKKPVLYALSLLLYSFALMSKENAFIFPMIVTVFCAARYTKSCVYYCIPYFVLAATGLFLYKLFNPDSDISGKNLSLMLPDIMFMFKTFFLSFTGFSRSVLWVFSDVNKLLFPVKQMFRVLIITGFVFFGITFYRRRKHFSDKGVFHYKTAFFALMATLLAYLPVSLFIPATYLFRGDAQLSPRYLYFPAVWFCVFSAQVITALLSTSKRDVLKYIFILSLLSANVVSVYQTQWVFSYVGQTRRELLRTVVSLHERHREKPYIFLVDYPKEQINIHLFPVTLVPMFHLYGKNVIFVIKDGVRAKAERLGIEKVCFFEWANVTFVDKTTEYVRAIIEKQR